jgi:serine/threonine protein kinase
VQQLFSSGQPYLPCNEFFDILRLFCQLIRTAMIQEASTSLKFTMVGRLAPGGSCEVWKVKDKATGMHFALKITGQLSAALFTQEVKILQKLKHSNVIEMFDSYHDPKQSTYNIVTALCAGSELLAHINARFADRRSFTNKEAADFARQLLEAIAYCHSVGVAHRDLKFVRAPTRAS